MAPQDREKKGGLTLEKLASYDDVITDALVDKVYYWTTIRKNRGGRFSASRGLHAEDIGDIIRKHIVLNKDPTEAVQHLLRLPGLRKYLSSLKDEKEKEHFTRHLRRYVSIYMPDCPFEVTTTNRYTISEHEASIKARRDINPREEIKYLTGVQVAMTEEQEKTLELARKDFSLVISSRKKTRSLFLGPARFANHDCDANARLSTKGYDGMQIVAVKPIAFGDEITVSYGEDYFGEDNEECLCHTCEEKQVNGWAPFKRVETDSDEDEDEDEDDEEKTPAPEEPLPEQDGSYSFRRKRKYGTTIEENSSETLPASKRVKVEKPQSPSKRHAPQPLRKRTLKKAYSASSLRKEVPVSSIENTTTNLSSSTQLSREIRTQQRVGLLTVTLDETSTSREDTPDSSLPSILADSPKSSESTDATSVDEDQPMANTEQISKVDLDVIKQKPGLGVVTVKTETTIATPSWTALFDGDSSSDISDLSDSLDFDDKKQEMVKRKRPKTPPTIRNTRSLSRHAAQNGLGTPISGDSQLEEGYVENTRKPGDYMTSAALLSAKYSKWVECSTCDEEFVQEDGYLTRKECPRCERHSILYGFTWPKTDREGKHDTDERILDHRTVHRFVDADEEKTLKKEKGRKLMRERIASRFSTPRSDYRESSMSMEAESGRKRKRVRKTM
ncbi:histone-lysine N-methyltransferase SET9 [Massariosphaeria phaeospora]|uniref:Histone-lysine N-methyltransferase SET9 n=1 Tax=Massariosphaeria phaeospora TaxID=100035 RepID=A0A7C8MRG7_9PLEO|nr:histone-lysine N-methyltransferase SET9 [Massariosphaeria phaeospora]